MIVVMKTGYSPDQFDTVQRHLADLGYTVLPIVGEEKTILAAVGGGEHVKVDALDQIRAYDWVEDVIFITKPYKLVAKESKPGPTVLDVKGVRIGGDEIVMMAGPCTVESEHQLMTTAEAVAKAGAKILRGGAYKPSTSPYSYQGMGVPGLELLQEAGRRFGMGVIT
ncbi:MAG: 3-deoxy-7-phosphoheptulonate synthase, partial [Fimbriimonadaceae bacterium]